LTRTGGHGTVNLLSQGISGVLDGGGQIVGADVEDVGSALGAQCVPLTQLTVDMNTPVAAVGCHVRPSSVS